MSSPKFKNQSIELVGINPTTNQFYLTKEAQQFLMSLDKPIAIITIAGLYRTGKSFLVNKLIKDTNSTHGFRVGSTTNSVTKGLNMWGKPITIQTQSGAVDYLLIDSEGIGSCQQQIKYDTNLLILIFLISSTVVYNSVGAIDEQSLDQLQVILSLKNCIEKNNECKPKFIWVLRDFSLQLIDKNGHEMSPNQYLQTFLEQVNYKNPQAKRKNQIRKAIKENLGQRSCYTLVRPTMREQDLANMNMNKCKIRTQFIGQIQQLKDELFSGSAKDIKKINNKGVSGRLLFKTLSHYIQIINNDELPSVLDVWEEVVKQNNNEVLDECYNRIRYDVKLLQLPMPDEELKRKLNDIQNRIYNELEGRITDQYKKYHKQYIKQVQSINKEIKTKNQSMLNRKTMGQLRAFAKDNISYDKIKPTNITELKNTVQRMKVKANNNIEAYQYIIQTILDVHFVIQKKSVILENEANEIKLMMASSNSEKKHSDLVLINMKKEYHEALKTITKLQQNEADTSKDYLVMKTQNSNYENKLQRLQREIINNETNYTTKIQEIQHKYKCKTQQYNDNIKRLRQENMELSEQLQSMKNRQLSEEINNRKEVIFEEKIQNAWSKFNQEKMEMNRELSEHKRELTKVHKQYEQLSGKYTKECEKREQEREESQLKEASFENQLKNLKKCISDTKNSYALTYQTIKTNQKVFKNIENKMNSQHKSNIKEVKQMNKQINKNKQQLFYEEYNNKQEEYRQHKQQLQQQISILNRQIKTLQTKLQHQQLRSSNYKDELREYRERCQKLQVQIMNMNGKFNECLREIETAKEKERALYEESIVRLLTNIDKHR